MTSSEKSSKIERAITSNRIFNDSTHIEQYKEGYRFNSDSMILSWYIYKTLKTRIPELAMEIGSGSGIIPIVLARHGLSFKTFCIEAQSSLFNLLKKNVKNNGLNKVLFPHNNTFPELTDSFTEKCDLIYTNPPYFPVDSGRLSPNKEKVLAKHEFSGSLRDFLFGSKKFLKKKGNFIFVYPTSRIQQALSWSLEAGFSLKSLSFYRENPSVPPSIFTANLILEGNNTVSTTELFTMRDKSGNYTDVGNEIMYDKN